MKDEKLKHLSYKIDKTIHMLCNDYEIDALSLTGVILARLKIIAEEGQVAEDFNKLLNHVVATPIPNKITVQ